MCMYVVDRTVVWWCVGWLLFLGRFLLLAARHLKGSPQNKLSLHLQIRKSASNPVVEFWSVAA